MDTTLNQHHRWVIQNYWTFLDLSHLLYQQFASYSTFYIFYCQVLVIFFLNCQNLIFDLKCCLQPFQSVCSTAVYVGVFVIFVYVPCWVNNYIRTNLYFYRAILLEYKNSYGKCIQVMRWESFSTFHAIFMSEVNNIFSSNIAFKYSNTTCIQVMRKFSSLSCNIHICLNSIQIN